MNQILVVRFMLIGLLACTLLACVACETAPVKPVDIDSNDVCYYCKSPIVDVQFAAEFITRDGFVRKFDDVACLTSMSKKIGRKKISAFYVMDVSSKTWVPAEQVQFVRSKRVATPRGSGIVAFKDVETAQNLAARASGELVRLDELLE